MAIDVNNRVIAVVFPLKARSICTMRVAKVAVLCVWGLSALLALPIVFIMNIKEVGVKYKGYWCVKDFEGREHHVIYELFMLCLIFVIPLTIMICTYVIICLKVLNFTAARKNMRTGSFSTCSNSSSERTRIAASLTRSRQGSTTSDIHKARPEDARTNFQIVFTQRGYDTHYELVVMLVVVVILFAVCWGPILINNVLVAFGVLNYIHYGYLKPMRKAFHLMSYFNSCLNPIVYAFFSKHFRQSFKLALHACFKGAAFMRAYRFSKSLGSARTSYDLRNTRRSSARVSVHYTPSIIREGSPFDVPGSRLMNVSKYHTEGRHQNRHQSSYD